MNAQPPYSQLSDKEIQKIGLSLREVKLDRENMVWFQGIDDSDFFGWKDENGNWLKFQLTFFCYLLDWKIDDAVYSGTYITHDDSSKGHTKVGLVARDNILNRAVLQTGLNIITFSSIEKDMKVIINQICEKWAQKNDFDISQIVLK